jgi:hypothetical protein
LPLAACKEKYGKYLGIGFGCTVGGRVGAALYIWLCYITHTLRTVRSKNMDSTSIQIILMRNQISDEVNELE